MKKVSKVVKFTDGHVHEFSYEGQWEQSIKAGEATIITGKAAYDEMHAFQRAALLKIIKPRTRLTAVCTGFNKSGMSATFRVFLPLMHDGKPCIREITKQVARFVGFRLNKHDEIVMGGCGYSKSFQIGYSLGCSLWPEGTPEPHGTRNGVPDSYGGYAISCD